MTNRKAHPVGGEHEEESERPPAQNEHAERRKQLAHAVGHRQEGLNERQDRKAQHEDEKERRPLPERLACEPLKARERIGEHQKKRARLRLAHEGVVGEEQREKRQQEDREAQERVHHGRQRLVLKRAADGGRAEEDGQTQNREECASEDEPAASQAVAELLARHDGNGGKGADAGAGADGG